jgi:hypothetical protein
MRTRLTPGLVVGHGHAVGGSAEDREEEKSVKSMHCREKLEKVIEIKLLEL